MPRARTVTPQLVEAWQQALRNGCTLKKVAAGSGYSRSYVGRAILKLERSKRPAPVGPPAQPQGPPPALEMPGNLARLIAEENAAAGKS